MTELLTIIGALFLVAGMVFGLISVYWGSKLQYSLFEEHSEVFTSGNLWKYIKSREGNEIPEIFRRKNRIKRSFMWFCILSLLGIASFLAAFVVFIAP